MPFFLLMVSLFGFGTELRSIILPNKANETVWLRETKINKTQVFLMGYRSPKGVEIEKVVPKQEFKSAILELDRYGNTLVKKQIPDLNSSCLGRVLVLKGKRVNSFCLDRQPLATIEQLNHFVRSKGHLLSGSQVKKF